MSSRKFVIEVDEAYIERAEREERCIAFWATFDPRSESAVNVHVGLVSHIEAAHCHDVAVEENRPRKGA